MKTLVELKELLALRLDPNDLLEILNISSEELVEAFSDKIEDNYKRLLHEYDD